MDTPYPLPSKKPYTGHQVRTLLQCNGMTIIDWALSNTYPPSLVYSVISGRSKATHGKSHEIALKLGMKLPVEKICA